MKRRGRQTVNFIRQYTYQRRSASVYWNLSSEALLNFTK